MTEGNRVPNWLKKAEIASFNRSALVGGVYLPTKEKDTFTTVNPATETEIAVFTDTDTATVDLAVTTARKAFASWRLLSADKRKSLLIAFVDRIQAARETLALFDTVEMGMPIANALKQVDDAVGFLRYNAELIDKVYGEIAPADPANMLALSQPEPRGVIGIISPWNFPLATAMLAIAPALAAGNTLVVKPSEQSPSSVLKLAEIAVEAGLPAGIFNVVPGRGITTGATLASHRDINKLHFTGSTQVGRQLMVYAGQSNGKSVMLELGGKSPQIVFEDAADLTNLGVTLAQEAFYNSGQLCVAKTRLLVHENIKEQVIAAIKTEIKNSFTIGSPLDETTTFGPISSRKQYDHVKHYLNLGQEEGADMHALKLAGTQPKTGYFIQPALFDNTKNTMCIAQEEIFGPILSVISFKTDEDALQLANGVNYGLAATVWTKNLGRARRFARDLNAGYITISATTAPVISPNSLSTEPFGESGHGILGGRRGLEAYQRTKAVQIITD